MISPRPAGALAGRHAGRVTVIFVVSHTAEQALHQVGREGIAAKLTVADDRTTLMTTVTFKGAVA